ncbi:MAG: glutamine synthetase type III, partial [Pseudobutyrivibrio sp.]|nr:glutamine synthetase type III [Pseudobutyrivibrio sp.]
VSNYLKETKEALVNLRETNEKAYTMKASSCEKANYYHDEVVKAMDALRAPVDALEMIVDKESWPMPSYGDMIFEV